MNIIIKNIIIFIVLYYVYISNINSLNKRIIYIILFMYIVVNIYEPFNNYSRVKDIEDKKVTNPYPIKSYDNIEKLTYDYYKRNLKNIINNIENTTTDIDLEKYAWPSNFNNQSQDYLDKTRFLKTNIPFPTNADFFR